LRIDYLRGDQSDSGNKNSERVQIVYLLMSDKETYVVLGDQDSYAYHDFDSEAKLPIVRKDPVYWEHIKLNHPEAGYREIIYG
jgi:hypothetical protein